MNRPTMSFIVVINGPVANAGSIFNLCKVNGTMVPESDANIITENNEMLTVSAKLIPSLKKKL